jgi:hypothetical protein
MVFPLWSGGLGPGTSRLRQDEQDVIAAPFKPCTASPEFFPMPEKNEQPDLVLLFLYLTCTLGAKRLHHEAYKHNIITILTH